MISSNYSVSSNNNLSPVRDPQAVPGNQAATATGESNSNSYELRNYLGGANQDVQNLRDTPATVSTPPVFQLSFGVGVGVKFYNLRVNVMDMAGQSAPDLFPFGQFRNSRIFAASILSEELARDYPELVGRALAIDIQNGIDSRLGVQTAIQALVADAAENKGKLGYEQRTGAQVSQDQDGHVRTDMVGGRDGIDLRMPGGIGGRISQLPNISQN